MKRLSRRAVLIGIRPELQGFLFGLFVAVLLIVADRVSMHVGLKESQRIADDICGGAIAGIIVFSYARAKTQFISERLKTIALMNHHIRNALQVVTYAGYLQSDPELAAHVNDAVQRIDWALREVLPGHAPENEDRTKPPQEAHRDGFSATA